MNMKSRKIKLKGVTYEDAQENIKALEAVEQPVSLTLVREPDNPADPNAIRVESDGNYLGYIPRADAIEVAPLMDNGFCLAAQVVHINEAPGQDTVGLTVKVFGVPATTVSGRYGGTPRYAKKTRLKNPEWFREAVAMIRRRSNRSNMG